MKITYIIIGKKITNVLFETLITWYFVDVNNSIKI